MTEISGDLRRIRISGDTAYDAASSGRKYGYSHKYEDYDYYCLCPGGKTSSSPGVYVVTVSVVKAFFVVKTPVRIILNPSVFFIKSIQIATSFFREVSMYSNCNMKTGGWKEKY